MPLKGKKFIDKKKAVSFQLVNRSQQDPLIADETAPQRVLLPVTKGNESKAQRDKRIEEQHKYGVYFDDEYNYLQNLKQVTDNTMAWPENVDEELEERRKAKIQLPSSVFASSFEEEVGMLNKAAPISGPQLNVDPDIVAAMDEDFDYNDPNNELEDNFIELADGIASDQELDDSELEDIFDERDEDGYVSSDFDGETSDVPEKTFAEQETKSRITRYSLSSSVLPRNDNLVRLDLQFEKKIAEYDDDKIGVLDLHESDEEETPIANARVLQLAEEYEQELADTSKTKLDKDDEVIQKTKSLYRIMDNDTEFVTMPVDEKVNTTCRFVPRGSRHTRTPIHYTNKANIIDTSGSKIKISKKTGVPVDEINSNKLALKALESLPNENEEDTHTVALSRISQLSIRSKDETSEERRRRKGLLKEYRQERRVEKKANALAFKEENKRQNKIAINKRKNIQGTKILS